MTERDESQFPQFPPLDPGEVADAGTTNDDGFGEKSSARPMSTALRKCMPPG